MGCFVNFNHYFNVCALFLSFISEFNVTSHNLISLFPSVPHGTCLFSRYALFHLLSGNADLVETKRILFTSTKMETFDLFGTTIPQVLGLCSDGLERDWMRLNQGATLNPLYRDIFCARESGFLKLGRLAVFKGTSHHCDRLFFCPKCIREDIRISGIAFWKTVHQAPFVHICPTHLVKLQGECGKCRGKQVSLRQWRLPTDTCVHCQSKFEVQLDPEHATDAYVCFVKWCEEVLLNELNFNADHQIDLELQRLFGMEKLRNEIAFLDFITIFSNQYNVKSLNEFNERFGIRLNLKSVGKLVSEKYEEISLIEKLVIASVLKTHANKTSKSESRKKNQHKSRDTGKFEERDCTASSGEIAFRIGEFFGLDDQFLKGLIFFDGDARGMSKLCPWKKRSDFRTLLRLVNSQAALFRRYSQNRHLVRRKIRTKSVEQRRQDILVLVESGLRTRTQVRDAAPKLLSTVRKTDGSWLDLHVPTRHIPNEGKRLRYRLEIERFIQDRQKSK